MSTGFELGDWIAPRWYKIREPTSSYWVTCFMSTGFELGDWIAPGWYRIREQKKSPGTFWEVPGLECKIREVE
jgi:hypothetical protein